MVDDDLYITCVRENRELVLWSVRRSTVMRAIATVSARGGASRHWNW